MGEGSPPISDLVHSQCTEVSGEFQSKTQAPLAHQALHIPRSGFFISKPLFLRAWDDILFRYLYWSWGVEEGEPWRHFYPLWLSAQSFSTPSFPPHLNFDPRVHKTEEAFVQGSLNSLCWSFWPLTSVPFHKEKWSKRSWCFLPLYALAYISE